MNTLNRLVNARRGRDQAGIVAVNLALVIAFALYAVIQLSRTTLAAKQIQNRVKTITTEVGAGSNVSRLDETAILNTVADRAESILAAAKPLSGQANQILVTAKSIDGTVGQINANAESINGTVKSINGTLSSLAPVVNNIRGTPGNIDSPASANVGGVQAINIRVDNVLRSVSGIRSDLDITQGHVLNIDAFTANILASTNNALCVVLKTLPLLSSLVCGP